MSKIRKPSPGKSKFKPRWEVKIAEHINEKVASNISRFLRNPKVVRMLEPAIGAGIGAGVGVGLTADEPLGNKIMAGAGGAVAGTVGARLLRHHIDSQLISAVKKKSQDRLWQRTKNIIVPDFKNYSGPVAGALKKELPVKEMRLEKNMLNDRKQIGKFIKKLRTSAENRVIASSLKPQAQQIKQIPKKQREILLAGIYGKKRPGVGVTAGSDELFVQGKNIRATVLGVNQKHIDELVNRWLNTRKQFIDVVLKKDDAALTKRLLNAVRKKYFGVM